MTDSPKAVFLSYASQDAEAAKRIADALRAAGVEVWFDAEGGLEHGDEWDAKIRRQIKECVLFIPLISANTQAREEGYFRIEWELAAQRSLGIASGVAFILPVVIDDTREPDTLVPDRFRTVQWTRLPGGRVPPEVLQRLLKLWSHRTGALRHATDNRERQAEDGTDLRSPAAGSRWRRPAWLGPVIGLAAVVVAGAGGWLALRTSPAAAGPPVPIAPPAATPAAGAAPASEARQLVARARQLFVDRLDTTRDDCVLAYELLGQAQAKDPNDAEVWASLSQLHSYVLLRGWETGDTRREAARAAAQRAVRLDPQSFEARLAEVFLLPDTGIEAPEKEKLLRALRLERPTDKRLLRALASVLDRRGELAEADQISEEAAALPGGDPLSLYNKSLRHWFAGNTARAEEAMAAALRQEPDFTGALIFTAWYAAILHGDLDRARAALARVPAAEMQEDRPAYFAYFIEMLARQPEAAMARLQAVPRAWINDNWYRGPKAQLVGDVLAATGRPAAAAIEWRTALHEVDQRLKDAPTNLGYQFRRTMLLARLGDKATAGEQFQVMVERFAPTLQSEAAVPTWVTDGLIILGRHDEAIAQISRALRRERRAVDYTAATLRLDPKFDPLRSHPRFAVVIEEAARIEAAAHPSRDWPRDPELRRAHGIITEMDASVETISLAEDIVKAVLQRRPADPEATVVYAALNNYYINRGFDNSEERYVLARRYAERAVQLAPEEPEALAAMAQFLTFRGTDFTRAEALIRQAMDRVPAEPRYARILSYNVLRPTRLAEAMAQARENARRFPDNALVHYDLALISRSAGDVATMEQALDRTIALEPIGSAMIWKGWLTAWLHGDLPGFKSWLDRITGNFRHSERSVYMRYLYACLSGEAAYGIEAVRSFPGAWMNDYYYNGPRALLLADLLTLQGKPDLARTEYDRAIAEVRRVSAENSADDTGWRSEFWALLNSGRTDEARAAARRMMERLNRPHRPNIMFWWHDAIAAQLLAGERGNALALIREAAVTPLVRAQIRTALAIDRRMASYRNDQEIRALLAEPETKLLPGHPVRDWPKNPDLKRALELVEGLETIPDDLALAEQIVRPILDRAPAELEVVTVMARIQSAYLRRGFDRSDDRFAQARVYAERAMQLGPDEPEAMLALATYLFSRATSDSRTERLLRRAMELDPGNPRHGRLLADLFNVLPGRQAEAIAQSQDNVRRFPRDVLSHYDLARHYKDQGRYEEFDRELDATLALAPLPNAIVWKARLEFGLRNDFAGMKAWLDRVPERVRSTERAVFGYFLYAAFGGDPEAGLEALRGFTQKWFSDFEYSGPTALLNAALLEVWGKKELARQQYEVALLEIQRMRATDPARVGLSQVEFWTLFGLGRLEEARVAQRRIIEGLRRPYGQSLVNGWWFSPIPGALLSGERATALELLRESVTTRPESRAAFRLRLQLDPRMAPFRDDAEIKALLADPAAG